MTPSDPTPSEPPPQDSRATVRDWVVGVLLVEWVALLIGLVTPITPSKTGSTWSPAHLVSEDPTYLQKALASFIVVNVLIVLLGLIAWVATRVRRSD